MDAYPQGPGIDFGAGMSGIGRIAQLRTSSKTKLLRVKGNPIGKHYAEFRRAIPESWKLNSSEVLLAHYMSEVCPKYVLITSCVCSGEFGVLAGADCETIHPTMGFCYVATEGSRFFKYNSSNFIE